MKPQSPVMTCGLEDKEPKEPTSGLDDFFSFPFFFEQNGVLI